jgi:hypothetical protein
MKQKIIVVSGDCNIFQTRVNQLLDRGWVIIPGPCPISIGDSDDIAPTLACVLEIDTNAWGDPLEKNLEKNDE